MDKEQDNQKNTDKGMEHEPLLANVNVCTMTNDELMKILDVLD